MLMKRGQAIITILFITSHHHHYSLNATIPITIAFLNIILTMPVPMRNIFIINVNIFSTYIVIIRRTRVDEERSSTSSRTSSKSRIRERRRSYGGHSRGVRSRICIFETSSEKTYLYL